MQRMDTGTIDIGDLPVLMPAGTHLALLKFESDEDFCLSVKVEHTTEDERLQDMTSSKCWTAGKSHIIFKLEPSRKKGFYTLTFGLNDLNGGATASSNEIPIGEVFGVGQDVAGNVELSGKSQWNPHFRST